jgi:hypothetical protein
MPGDKGNEPEDMYSEKFCRRCLTLFFEADFDTFDGLTGPRGVPDVG